MNNSLIPKSMVGEETLYIHGKRKKSMYLKDVFDYHQSVTTKQCHTEVLQLEALQSSEF